MDKYEYKVRSEEIKTLIARGEYAEAAEIADSIDWRRVKSVMMLCTISDLYKINRRFEDSRDLLLLAYDRHPGGRSIVYSLCELSIKMGDFVQAVEYYKEFVQVAPRDSGKYVLQYKLYEAQDVSLEERIAVLEELKARDYTEKWAYELAYLYHRVGLGTRCVEECDELILWFGDGKYVMKAMELKMLHEPLTPQQQEKYNAARGMQPAAKQRPSDPVAVRPEEQILDSPTVEIPSKDPDIQVKLMGVGQYDTINIQKELAENMKELWEGAESGEQEDQVPEAEVSEPGGETKIFARDQIETTEDKVTQAILAPMLEEDSQSDEMTDSERTTLAETMTDTNRQPEEIKTEEVFFGETADLDATADQVMEAMKAEVTGETAQETVEPIQTGEVQQESDIKSVHHTYDKMLGMEYDGQLSMLLPESEQIEKQITGQIKLEDVLLEWERMKKDSEQKRMEAVRQRVLEQTGAMFTEFEASMRDGLLEKLENEKNIETPEDVEDVEETPDLEDLGEIEEIEEIKEIEEIEEIENEEEPDEVTVSEEDAVAASDGLDESALSAELIETAVEEEEPAGEDPAELEEETAEPEEETAEPEEETAEPEEETVEPEEETAEPEEETAEPEKETAEPEEETAEPEEETAELEEETAEPEEETAEPEEETTEPEEETAEPEEETAEPEEETAEPEKETAEPEEETVEPEEADVPESQKVPDKNKKTKTLSPEEMELFGAYAHSSKAREQIIHAIDAISMASYTGNVIITGDEGMDPMTLAKNLVKEIQNTDSNFSGKIAKISGVSLNKKDLEQTLDKLAGGALIVQKASGLSKESAEKLHKVLEQEERGIIVLLMDTKKAMNRFLHENHFLKECFNIRVDVEAMDNDSLVEYGKKYAREQEYSIDDLGVLALHTRISDMQTSDHAVTVSEVREIMDEAIRHANRKTFGHFVDILIAKRYDDEDMIILREKDFV